MRFRRGGEPVVGGASPTPSQAVPSQTPPTGDDVRSGWELPNNIEGDWSRREDRRKRVRPPVPRWRLAVVVLIAVASGFGTAMAGMEPTGSRVPDLAWSALLGAVVALAGSRARRWALICTAAIATATATGWFLVPAFAALGVALSTVAREQRLRITGALVAGVSVQCLVRIGTWDWAPFGTSAVVTAVAAGIVVASGWLNTRPRWRKATGRLALGVAAAVALVVAGFLAAVVMSYPQVSGGVAAARAGLDATASDETQAATQFRRSANRLAAADRWLGSPLLLPASAVPVIAQQYRAVSDAVASAEELASVAATGASLVERGDLRPTDGRIDTDALTSLVPELTSTVATLESASGTLGALANPWLIPPVADRLDQLSATVDDVLPTTRLALEGAEAVPGMVGADGTRRWLVLLPTPAESRLLGGFVGNWALLEATDGRIDVVDDGAAKDVNGLVPPGGRRVDADEEFRLRYDGYLLDDYFQNSTVSPDFPSSARVASSFFSQSTGVPVEGVISLDPVALGALVDLTGPLTVPSLDRSFTGDELADFLLTDLYTFDEATQDTIFAEAIEGTVDGLTSGALPGPGALTSALGEAADEGRILMWSSVPEEEAFIGNVGIAGALPPNEGQDFLFVGVANLAPNKLDVYLERTVGYSATWDPVTGAVDGEAVVILTNAAPNGLPPVVEGNGLGLPPGTARLNVSLYSPLLATSFEVDGEPSAVEPQREGGWRTWSRVVEIPRGESVELRYRLAGTVDPGTYRFEWRPQPLLIPTELDVNVIAEPAGPRDFFSFIGPAAGRVEGTITP